MTQDFIPIAQDVIDTELNAIKRLKTHLNVQFNQACHAMLSCQGRVIVLALGKSGHIGHKIAATLASTGTPAFFVHASEASHGDLGMITEKDVVLVISYSGKTPEILTLLPMIKKRRVPLIAITGNPSASIAKLADIHLDASVEKEACPHNLAPTASTTAALVLGDALAIALLHHRGFTQEDFASSHPGGELGKRLLLTVKDIMRRDPHIPRVSPDATLSAAIIEITGKKLGFTSVVDAEHIFFGIFTDGDLRRALDKKIDIQSTTVKEVMTKGGITVTDDTLAVKAAELLERHKITGLVVVDALGRVIGALNIHDLFQAGIL